MTRKFSNSQLGRSSRVKIETLDITLTTKTGHQARNAVRTMMLSIVAIWLYSAGSAQAQGSNAIGFVDIPYLIQKAPQAVEAERRLEAEFAPRQAELAEERERLSAMSAELTDLDSGLSEADRLQLDREVRALERRIKRSEQDFREELNIQKNDEFKHVRERVLDAIARFGREHDYDLIVSDGVLYANERIDVTDRILEALTIEIAQRQSSN